jgi:Ca2+-binding EF-hand superfamily protein
MPQRTHAGAQLTCSTHVLAQSKMEFRQYLRDIGIMGKAFTAAQVDKLFMELDGDGSGELDPSEIVEGVVLFKKNAKEAKEKTQKAEANAAHWRARAACAEKAAEAVRRYEDAKLEIERIKNEPSAESRLAEMFRKKNLKPMDMMQQFDNDKNGAIDLSEFMFNIRKMGLEASDEDLGRIFASFDSDGSGTLDMKELQTNMHKLNDAQSAEAELLKTLQKDLKTLQLAAQAEQEVVQQQIEEDEATEKAEAALKAEAAKRKEEEEALALAKAEEAKKKKEAKLAEEKALFEEKVYERRLQKQNTIAGIKDTMPMPLAKALTKRKSGDEED